MANVLHHLAIGARDVARVAAFYSNVFGLPEQARHHRDDGALRSIWLAMGEVLLMVEHTEEALRRCDVGAGPFLLAFRVSVADRAGVEARLAAHGSPIEARTDFTSYARDPEGNRVAISHYPKPSTAT